MKFNKNVTKGKWFSYEINGQVVEILIKPFSAFTLDFTPAETRLELSNENIVRMINHCIADWKNILDENGDLLECNLENKMIVCEALPDLFSFIADKASLLREELVIKEEELKN
jgi:hypothetical protein